MAASDVPSLLLLPFPPKPADRPALSTAYKPAIAAALSNLKDAPTMQTLIVAVACPILKGPALKHKRLSWPQAQHLLAGLYAIISIVCVEQDIPSYMNAGAGSVDARVILLDHDRTRRYGDKFRSAIEPNNTAIVDLSTFASAHYPWKLIFTPDSEAAHELQGLFSRLTRPQQTILQNQLIPVKGGLTLNIPSPTEEPLATFPDDNAYRTVCLGGTFDHLHPGHKLLLGAGAYLLDIPEKGSSATCTYIIGITGDELLKNKANVHVLEPWVVRARNVIHFLSTMLELSIEGWKRVAAPPIEEKNGESVARFRDGTITIQCVMIQDPFGPTITQEHLDSLVVSAETRSGGKAVNDARTKLGWNVLAVFEVDVLDAGETLEGPPKAEDFSSKISSTAIRRQIAEATAA